MNKHEHPPTPTIEGLEAILNTFERLVIEQGSIANFQQAEAKAALTLLITKASEDEHDDLHITFQEAMRMAGLSLELQSNILQNMMTVTRKRAKELKATTKDKE